MSADKLESLIARLEKSVIKLENAGAGGGSGDSAASVPASVVAYDEFEDDFMKPYYEASAVLGELVDEQAKLFKELSAKHRNFLMVVAKHSAPKASDFQQLLAPMSEQMKKVSALKDLKHKNYCSAVSEGIMAFSWVGYPKTPMKFVEGTRDAVKFYTNKVLVESKNTDKKEENRAWVKAFTAVFDGLIAYIKDHHRTGPTYSTSPTATSAHHDCLLSVLITEEDKMLEVAVAAAAVPFGIPPPPPIVKQEEGEQEVLNFELADRAKAALMVDLNKGLEITAGLKKVDRSQMTHKNPELRNRAPVPFKSNASSYKPVGLAAKKAVKKPAKFDLEDGKKWIIEYQEGAKLTIEDSNMKQVVYIYKCENSTVLIDGKVNSVILDSCKKVGLVFNAVVAGSEVVNCQSVKIQARGQCPTISIDKTDGCLVYLSDECLDCQIVSAKSSEMNISIPREDGDYDEHPVAEQFRSHYDAKKKTIVTECTDSLG